MKLKNQLTVASLAKGNQFLANFQDQFGTLRPKCVMDMGRDISKQLNF